MAASTNPLAGAKSAISKANNLTKSVEGTNKSMFAPKSGALPRVTTPVAKAASKPTNAPSTWGAATRSILNNNGQLPKMHKGGVVPGRPGEEKVVKLEAGEKVTPAKDTKMAEEKKAKPLSVKDVLAKDKKSKEEKTSGKKKKYRHTHIEHHADGSHTIRHTPAEGGEEMSYSRPDTAGMMQGLQDNLGGGEQGGDQGDQGGEEPPAGGAPQE